MLLIPLHVGKEEVEGGEKYDGWYRCWEGGGRAVGMESAVRKGSGKESQANERVFYANGRLYGKKFVDFEKKINSISIDRKIRSVIEGRKDIQPVKWVKNV